MFVAVFDVVNNKNNKFETDKNGNLPFIGSLKAGVAKSLIVNGSVFKEQKRIPQRGYLCQNIERTYVDETTGETKTSIDVDIVQVLTAMDMIDLKDRLGEPVDLTVKSTTNAGVEEHADQESF